MTTDCVLDFDIDKVFLNLSKQGSPPPYVYHRAIYEKPRINNQCAQQCAQQRSQLNNSYKYYNWLTSLFSVKVC